ncbi:MAG: hypothetical protein AB2A00_11870 [Myxococcota bacterium]
MKKVSPRGLGTAFQGLCVGVVAVGLLLSMGSASENVEATQPAEGQQPAPAAPAEAAPAPATPPPAEPAPEAPAPAPAAPAAYPKDDEAAAIAWMDERFPKSAYPELYEAIKGSVDTEKRPEIQWRIVRTLINYYEMKRTAPDAEKLKVYAAAERLSRECIAKAGDKVPHCYLYLGISLGRQGTVKGVLKSLRLAKEVEQSWLKGLSLSKGKPYKLDKDSLESHFYYVLGIFYRIVPDWWIVKVVAGTRGDKQKSIEFHRESVRLRPDVATHLELGVSLMCRGYKEDDDAQFSEGKKTLENVLKMPAKDELDRIDQRNAQTVLNKPKLACGYSRDKFQDVESEGAVK